VLLGLKRLSVEREVWLVEERGLVSGIACLKSKLALEQAASDTCLGRKEVYLVGGERFSKWYSMLEEQAGARASCL
jgi:hypothetical protein